MCSSGGDTTTTTESSQQQAQSDRGSDAAPAAAPGATIPASVRNNVPATIPGGWDKDILADLGLTETTGSQLLYPHENFDLIAAFYDQRTADQPDDYFKTEGPDIVVFSRMESPTSTITVGLDGSDAEPTDSGSTRAPSARTGGRSASRACRTASGVSVSIPGWQLPKPQLACQQPTRIFYASWNTSSLDKTRYFPALLDSASTRGTPHGSTIEGTHTPTPAKHTARFTVRTTTTTATAWGSSTTGVVLPRGLTR